MKLAIFDVDLTITRKDTFLEFYKFICKEDKRFLAYLNKVIFSGAMYGLKIFNAKKSKECYLCFLKGVTSKWVNEISEKFFYQHIIQNLVYIDALREIQKHKKLGNKVILISASPEFYLKYFKELECIDYVIGTKCQVENGFYTGKIIGENNKGNEKIYRLFDLLRKEKLDNVNFNDSYMYSDSFNDIPLFNLVGNRFLINSKKTLENTKNLYWK